MVRKKPQSEPAAVFPSLTFPVTSSCFPQMNSGGCSERVLRNACAISFGDVSNWGWKYSVISPRAAAITFACPDFKRFFSSAVKKIDGRLDKEKPLFRTDNSCNGISLHESISAITWY
jgi:hypothetical protein